MTDLSRGQSALDAAAEARMFGYHADLSERMEEPEPAPWKFPSVIGASEWDSARPTPDCIVEGYIFADVGVFIAPGGTGKTTIIIFEAIHIALGLPLWGLEVRKPGPVLLITAEDTREMLVARLREIVGVMNLSAAQVELVRQRVLISDVASDPIKLTAVFYDVVRPNHVVEEIISACRPFPPVLIVIDPAISFGVGESRVNDAEQGLVEAARKLRNALNCAVRYVHHTGKINGREKSLDQYSGRGGSAFSDGARMVTVMQRYDEDEWRKLTGKTLGEDESGLILARPKLSYAPPQPDLYIVRDGYRFDLVTIAPKNPMADLEATANQVLQLVREELKQGRKHSRNTIESLAGAVNLKRQEMRDSVKYLIAAGRIYEMTDRVLGKRGGQHRHLVSVDIASPNSLGEPIANEAESDD